MTPNFWWKIAYAFLTKVEVKIAEYWSSFFSCIFFWTEMKSKWKRKKYEAYVQPNLVPRAPFSKKRINFVLARLRIPSYNKLKVTTAWLSNKELFSYIFKEHRYGSIICFSTNWINVSTIYRLAGMFFLSTLKLSAFLRFSLHLRFLIFWYIFQVRFHVLLPYSIVAVLAFLCSVLCFLLPETRDTSTLENIDSVNSCATEMIEKEPVSPEPIEEKEELGELLLKGDQPA